MEGIGILANGIGMMMFLSLFFCLLASSARLALSRRQAISQDHAKPVLSSLLLAVGIIAALSAACFALWDWSFYYVCAHGEGGGFCA